MIRITDGFFNISVEYDGGEELLDSLEKSFPRRYIPKYSVLKEQKPSSGVDASIKWFRVEKGFRVVNYTLGEKLDEYIIESPPPKPYVSESPVFFLLQVITRSLIKKGYIVLTDTAAIWMDGITVLLMGYPHTGKSTLSALALYMGDVPLSTENTVLEISEDGARVLNGTSILVYDPRIENLYSVRLEYDELTKHGYRVIDLDRHLDMREEILRKKPVVDEIYVLHCSYTAGEPDLEPIRGRKIKKTIWYFATALIKGVDYYEPNPINLLTDEVEEKLSRSINVTGEIYSGRINEIYGRHDKVYEFIKKRRNK